MKRVAKVPRPRSIGASLSFGRLLRDARCAMRAACLSLFAFRFSLLGALATASAHAQVAPDLHWRTLTTAHFRVHSSPGLDTVARRAAASAERAYTLLAKELHAPRGPIDLVVADNVDVSNGYTTPFPSNRIVIYARPAVDANSLKFLDDWVDLVVTHELAHVFHLDRTRGWWRLAQYVFGRNPFLFPNLYAPSWIAEGIAVHYETRLTGAGRLAGTDFAMTARAKALDGSTPSPQELSAATPRFPLGSTAYVYGAQLLEAASRSGGPGTMRHFVEVSSARTLPFLLNTNARSAFGATFDRVFRVWSDSVRRDALRLDASLPGTGDLTASGWFTSRVRWVDSARLVYGNADGRGITALKELRVAGGAPRFVARRNNLDATSPLPDGTRLFAQQDFVDPYTVRSDLFVEEEHGNSRRLTTGARLMQPDARPAPPDASSAPSSRFPSVVAVQIVPGASRLVLVVPDGDSASVVPLTGASMDTVWSEPRWSHDGARIAATRWLAGGVSEIVVLDTTGRVVQRVGRSRAVNVSPAWGSGDRTIYFTSDRSGRSALYRATLAGGGLELVAEAATGLFESEPSPDGAHLATLHVKGDGYHVALVSAAGGQRAESASVLPPSRFVTPPAVAARTGAYASWRSLLPRYWLPTATQSDERRTMWGIVTSGADVIGRHQYELQAAFEPHRAEPSGRLSYRFSGFGNPVLDVSGEQLWDHFDVLGQNVIAGTLARRAFVARTALTVLRPRVRTNAFFSAAAELEWRDFRTDPGPLLATLDPLLSGLLTYPALAATGGWGNTRQPLLAISPEDGFAVTATVRQRWRSGASAFTRSTSAIGEASAYRSLDLPGFAHHVVAVRGAAGWEDSRASTELRAGGASGSIVGIGPGVILGDGRRTFFARGFPPGAQQGTRALAGNVEYRLPIALPASGVFHLPLFLQKTSASVFGDAATAWCPNGPKDSPVCPSGGTPREWMASAGAEFRLDAALQYDAPIAFRLGVATPLAGRQYFGASAAAAYFTVGLAF